MAQQAKLNPIESLERGIALAMDDFQRQQRGEPPNPDPAPRLVTVGVCPDCAEQESSKQEPREDALFAEAKARIVRIMGWTPETWAAEVQRCEGLGVAPWTVAKDGTRLPLVKPGWTELPKPYKRPEKPV